MKPKILHGASILSIFLLGASITAGTLMEKYTNQMDQTFGTVSQIKTYEKVSEGEASDPWTFKSKFKTAKEAVEGYKEFAIREAEETFALLKNNENALPIASNAKITMFGVRSYAPVYGNSAGSIADRNTIDNFHTEIYNAFKEKGFNINPSMKKAYENYFADKAWGSQGFGASSPEYGCITGTDKVYELSLEELSAANPAFKSEYANYNDAAIVVVGRPGGESKEYRLNDQGQNTSTGNVMGLSTEEKQLIEEAKANFNKVIVLINSVDTMEFKELKDDDGIDAILWMGYPGPYGCYALADVLNGKVSPSAYLTDTHVTNAQATPAMKNFGDMTPWTGLTEEEINGNNVNSYLVQAEGIYTGYRYFETRYAEIVNGNNGAKSAKAGTWTQDDYRLATTDGEWRYNREVVYPFGYGLSYTTFKEEITSVEIKGDKKTATVKVNVKNTGTVDAKHSVQLYAQTPYTQYDKDNGVEKSAIQLVDFEKSGVIKAGESEEVVLHVDMSNLASYDYKTAKTYILDAGDYYFTTGNGAHDALNNILAKQGKTTADGMTENGDASKVYTWNWGDFDSNTFAFSANGTKITNKLSEGDFATDLNAFMPNTVNYLSRSDFNSTYPKTYSGLTPNDAMKKVFLNDFYTIKTGEQVTAKFGQKSDLNLIDLKGASWDDERWDELANKVTIAEFLAFAQSAFHNIAPIESVGYKGDKADDGPGGSDTHYFDEGTYQGVAYADAKDYETTKPGTRVGPSQQNLAAAFNKELAYENGEIIIGETSLILQLPIIIGPGVNLHRHGLNGRGGEYFSEDPILSGYVGSAVVQGAESKGCLVNIKHVAFNDQEINRSGVATFFNEQSARELELRNLGNIFEKKGMPAKWVGVEEKKDSYSHEVLGVMTSYNRIGAVASSANKAVVQDIMREQWGFHGYNVTDFTGVSKKACPKESILYGTTAFCGFGVQVDYWSEDALKGDATLTSAIHEDIKYILYSLANSNALNGVSSDYKAVIKQQVTWWRVTYVAMISVFSLTTLAGLGSLVYFGFIRKEKGAK